MWFGFKIRKESVIRIHQPQLIALFIFLSGVLSLAWGGFFMGVNVVVRDFFELYRFPYFIIVIIALSQISWTYYRLSENFFKVILSSFVFIFIVSFLQMFDGLPKNVIEFIYNPKYGSDISRAYGDVSQFRMRNSGTFGNPNFYGVILAYCAPFLLVARGFVSGLYKSISLVVFLLACLFVLLSGSRTGVICLFISLTVYFILNYIDSTIGGRKKEITTVSKKLLKRILLCILIVFIVASFYQIYTVLSRYAVLIEMILSGNILEDSSIGAKYQLSAELIKKVFVESPLLGFGPSKFTNNYLGDNQYTVLLFRYGLLGTLLWLGFWLAICFDALRIKKYLFRNEMKAYSNAVVAACISFLIACITGAFFDNIQLATVCLLFVGVMYGFSNDTEANESPKRDL